MFTACADDGFIGDKTALEGAEGEGAISFNSGSKASTRAAIGAEAAAKLNNNFVIEGIKTISSTSSEVFDNYNVNYAFNW
jgi:hypothetical protein